MILPEVPAPVPVPPDRAGLARRIRAQKVPCREPYHQPLPKPSCWQCARNGAFERAARIVLGEWEAPR